MSGFTLSAAQIEGGSLIWIAVTAYVGGLLTAFTPCVYPLIPITIGIMGAQGARSVFRAFLLSLAFVMGLAAVYSLLGLTAASTGKLLGATGENVWFTWGVALLFLAMGLSLLGVFEIHLPSSMTTALARHGHSGFAGSFVLGAVSGVLAAPCSGPVAVGILGYVTQKSNPWLGFFLLYLFSLGLGTPFLVLGTVSSWRGKLPATGIWTEWIKHIAGLAMVAAFFIYVRRSLPPAAFLMLVGLGFLSLSLFVQSVFPFRIPKPNTHVVLRTVLVVTAGVLIGSAWQNLEKSKVSAPPGYVWITNFQEGLKKASVSGKPVVVDFWADWCVACHELDDRTYSDPRVQKELRENFVGIKIDATKADAPGLLELTKRYGVTGLPTVLFLSPGGKVDEKLTLTGFEPPDEFIQRLNRAAP